MKLESIDHIHVYTPDRGKAEDWYRRVLGLTRIREWEHWAANDGPLFLSDPDRRVALALFERPMKSNHATIAFRVSGPDFLAWRIHLQAILGKIGEVDHSGSWSLYFSDLDGNPFEITSYDYDWIKGRLRP